jgi:hypothetical protein
MQFFLLDFALAFVALLGYRAVAAIAQDRVPAVSLEGSPRAPQRGGSPGITGPRRRVGQEPVLTEHPLPDDPSCGPCAGDTMSCGEHPPHRLINFW